MQLEARRLGAGSWLRMPAEQQKPGQGGLHTSEMSGYRELTAGSLTCSPARRCRRACRSRRRTRPAPPAGPAPPGVTKQNAFEHSEDTACWIWLNQPAAAHWWCQRSSSCNVCCRACCLCCTGSVGSMWVAYLVHVGHQVVGDAHRVLANLACREHIRRLPTCSDGVSKPYRDISGQL